MRTRKLRLVSALLALAMMFVIVPVGAFAENIEFNYDGLHYMATGDSEVTVVGPTEVRQKRVIPEKVSYNGKTYTVTSISAHAFNHHSTSPSGYKSYVGDMISVEVPKTVVSIGERAFFWCNSMETVTFAQGSKLKTLGAECFAGCQKLEEIEFPAEMEDLGTWTFNSCANLKKITFLGNKITSIGAGVFTNLPIEDFEIPSSVTELGNYAIAGCTNMKHFVIPGGVTKIGEYAFGSCSTLESIKIPSSVTEIGKNAFENCSALTTVIYDGTADQWKDLIHSKNGDVFGTTGNEKFQNPEKLKYRCTVTFDANGLGTAPATQQPYKGDALEAFEKPTAAGYTFAGWYDENGKPFDVTSSVEKNMKLTAKWEKIPDHKLTVSGGTFTVDGTEAEGDSADVQEGAEVKVTFKKDSDAGSNLVFDGWEIEGLENAEQYQDKESFAFTMPKNGVTIAARTKTVEEDSGWDAGTVVTTAVLGTGMAVLAYHIGTEVYAEQVLGAGVAVPRTRGDVALKAWELAGKPAVENAAAAPEEAAQAQQWVLESGLMENQKDGTFHPEKWMSRLAALRVLDKAQKMG